MTGGVGVQVLFQCAYGQPQSLAPSRHLHGFDNPIGKRQRA
jgi:hypothetical protein